MRLYVGITDGDWFRLLRLEPAVEEVNFWQPGGSRQFRALEPGELFLSKLHSPENFIVGGGLLATSSLLPCSLAWEAFERKNGARSFAEKDADVRPMVRWLRGEHRSQDSPGRGSQLVELESVMS